VTQEKLIMHYFSVLTHALAITAGWVLLSLANQEKPDTPTAHAPTSRHSLSSPHSRSLTSPRRLLTALTQTSMTPSLREDIKNGIYRDWASSDPIGLLNHLNGRAWNFHGKNAFINLARSQPENLLAYARQHGCIDALNILSSNGDPNVILNLYLTQKPGSIPASEFNTLFKQGLRSDPQFHLNINRINDTAARTEAFTATAKIWLELELYDTYFARFKELHNSLQLDTITHDFGYHILSNHKDVNLLHSLPETARGHTIKEIIEWMPQISSRDESYQRMALTTCLENGWMDGHIDQALYIIRAGAENEESDNSHLAEAIAWKNWGLALPDDGKWEPLRHTAIRRWIVADPTQWKTITQLPTPALRDIAYTAVLSTIDLENEFHQIKWITNQIIDPDLKSIAIRVIDERQDPDTDPDDPFAPSLDVDPFDPFAKDTPDAAPFSDTR
jgi:hypothetical protein